MAALITGCAPGEQVSPTPTASIVQVFISPAARPVHAALNACSAALGGIQVTGEERYAAQTSQVLQIRLGVPEEDPGFLAQIATDELAVVLHPENPVGSLTPTEIQALFTGQVANWAEYSGEDAPVRVWVPLQVDETRIAFESQVLQGLPVVSDARLAPDPESMQQTVTADPYAIGLMPNSWQPDGLQSILLGVRLPVLVTLSQPPEGPTAALVACLQGEVGQQALKERYP